MRYNFALRFLFVCLFATATSTVFGQAVKSFAVNGTLPVSAKGYVYLRYTDANGAAHKDSSTVSSGKFNFKGQLSGAVPAYISYQNSGSQVILEPAIINIKAEAEGLDHIITLGTPTQQEGQELRSALRKIEKRWKVVMDTLMAVNKRSNVKFQEYKAWVLSPYFAEVAETNWSFYDKHPSSYVTALSMRVTGRDMSDKELDDRYNRFSAAVKASSFGKEIAKQLDERRHGAVGTMATNFNHTDIDGKPLELASLKGKYVLLDFWGSWCVPCRKGNPHLLNVYAEYKSKGLEIVGIAADDRDPAAWRKAVAEDKLVWPQILQGNKPGDDLGKAYNIMYYPTKVLIDKQGKIIGRFGEEADELDKVLKTLM